MSDCRFTPSYHALLRYAQRVMGFGAIPTPTQMHTAGDAMLADFTDARVVKRYANDDARAKHHSRDRLVISERGTHAVMRAGLLITVYTPGTPVEGCWCEHCTTARAPATKRPTMPPHKRSLRRRIP